jgi:hypothetical protein
MITFRNVSFQQWFKAGLRTSVVFAVLHAAGSLAYGGVYDSSAWNELTGSRSIPAANGVVGSNFNTFQISWTIVYNPVPATFTYTYLLTGTVASGGQGLSHMILDTSDNCVNVAAGTLADPNCITNISISAGTVALAPGDYSTSGDPNFPATFDIVGVKFGVVGGPALPLTIQFTSDRAPVYGDFYVKVAAATTAYDNGLTLHATSTNILDFIARPDTNNFTPEPAGIVLSAGGLLLLGIIRRRTT